MDKRKAAIIISSIVLILVVVLVFVDKLIINRARGNVQDTQASIVTEAGMKNDDNSTGEGTVKSINKGALSDGVRETDDASSSEAYNTESLLRDEMIKVDGNTPEYDMELRLCERADKETFLELRYYLNGASVINDIDDAQIPELKEIFESRNSIGNKEAYIVKQALLNPVYSQLYVLIYGSAVNKYTQASLYEININDASVNKLMSYPGEYGQLSLNKDKSLMAYSFGDPPHMSQYQENFLIDFYDCRKAEYIIKSSRDVSGSLMGSNSNPNYLYDYEFTSWLAPRTARLNQTISSKKEEESVLQQGDVLYDIDKNLIMNLDGSAQDISAGAEGELTQQGEAVPQNDETQQSEAAQQNNGTKQGEAASGTDSTQNSEQSSIGNDANTKETGSTIKGAGSTSKKGESEQAKLIKSFYSYLESEDDYKKAMELLDKDFVFRMELLKQFGVEYIVKSDFDAQEASMYSQLLKAAKFDTIAKEELKDGIYTIDYYHFLGLNSDSQLRQLMIARMKKSDGLWRIISIEEGKE